ncbi:MAG: TonB-dependent receptor [Bacteroidales bacterium]|nr:TonB-dependent receptor [Bacteroidales bacterium]
MIKKIILLLIAFFFVCEGFSQTRKYTLSGYVRDSASRETLIGANVYVKQNSRQGTASNAYGFYSLTLNEGTYVMVVQYVGFKSQEFEIRLNKDQNMNFELVSVSQQLDAVRVTADRSTDKVAQTNMGVEKLSVKEVAKIPVLFGEKDVLKTISLTPGVKSSGEGSSGFYVRGGGYDQNLILLDEAVVFNASHLMGFFSVFNSDALRDVTLYKGTQPAEYGGRLASVLDVKMQEGNSTKYGVEGGIGLIASRLKIEGPIVKDKGSFILSGRRTYADLFLFLSPDEMARDATLYFYDLNLKGNYQINDRHRLYLSGYLGRDVLGLQDNFGIDWGNMTGTLRWNWTMTNRLFSNTSFIASDYDYKIKVDYEGNLIDILSRINNYTLKQDFTFYASSPHTIKFGFNASYYKILPGTLAASGAFLNRNLQLQNKYASDFAIYVSHLWKMNEYISVEYGLRATDFFSTSADNFAYLSLEPRLSTNWKLNDDNAIKASYTRNSQNLHLLSNSTSGNPTDLWIPSSEIVKPEIADQISLGYVRNIDNSTYEFSAEVYYKNLKNQIDYKDGASLNFNTKVDTLLLFGKGRGYGIELFFKKKYGRLTGWIGYTFSRIEKKIEGINNGEYYPAKQDRTHDVMLVAMFDINEKLNLSVSWVYYTGNAVTFPSGKYEIDDQWVSYYTERNAYRMPNYHRLDLGLTWLVRKTKRYESSWNFSLYNAYGAKNAYTITFETDENDPTRTRAIKTILFRWIPSFTYNFKF